MEEDDVLSLPLEQQWSHSKWNARQNAYKTVAEQFDAAAPEDPTFSTWGAKLGSAGTDSNVIALEAGLKCIAAFARGASPQQVESVRASLMPGMAEKAFAAVKPSVKVTFQATCQDLVENSAKPAAIIEELIPCLSAKSPKAVTAAIVNFKELYANFGRVLPLKPILAALPGLFGHSDRNIRTESSNLAVVLVQVAGRPVVDAALTGLKPVQLKELNPKFDDAQPLTPVKIPKVLRVDEEEIVEEGEEDGAPVVEEESLDPYDMAEPQEILSKLPDITEAVSSVKWKERKEALESVESIFDGVLKIKRADFGQLSSHLARVIQKDANLMCVTSALNITRMLAAGLRSDFTYASTLLPPTLERFKEKKASVLEAAINAAHAMYAAVGLDAVLSTICTGLSHKIPQARIESSKFVVKLLCEMTTAPLPVHVKEISEPALKNMTDSQEPVRAEAAKILAALVKIVDKAMNPVIAKLDDMRKQKVTDAAELVTVKVKLKPASKLTAAPKQATKSSAATKAPSQTSAARTVRTGARPSAKAGGNDEPAAVKESPAASAAKRRESLRPRPVTSTPQKASASRPLHQTEFTPAKQSQPLRRRLGTPDDASLTRARSPLRMNAPDLSHPDQRGSPRGSPKQSPISRHSPQQSPLATLEVDMLRREKLLADKELEMMKKQYNQERILRESAERQVMALKEEVDQLKRELNRRSTSANNSFDGSNNSLDGLNNRMSSLSLRDDSFEKLSSRPITLGAPRASSKLAAHDDESRSGGQVDRSRENWRRAVEVTNDLKKRVAEMKRSRLESQKSLN